MQPFVLFRYVKTYTTMNELLYLHEYFVLYSKINHTINILADLLRKDVI